MFPTEGQDLGILPNNTGTEIYAKPSDSESTPERQASFFPCYR